MKSTRRAWMFTLTAIVLAAQPGAAAEKSAARKLPSAKEVWLQAESPSFRVIGNISAKKLVEIAETLERFRSTLLQLKPNASPISPVPTLFIAFANDRAFDPYKGSPDSDEVKWVGTFQTSQFGNFFAVNAFPDRGNGMAVVFKGYTGHFIGSNYPLTPLWLREGLAEVYSTFRIEGEVADIGRPSVESLKQLRASPFMPLREILAMTAASPGYAGANRSNFSAQCWVLVHYLLYGSADGQLRTGEFLRRLEGGEPQSTAFLGAFGVEMDKFEGRLRLYATQPGFDYQKITLSGLPPTGVPAPRTMSRPETLTLLAGLPASMRRFDFAQQHLDAALAEEPGNADAWALAGRIAESRGEAAAAAADYRRAGASEPKLAASWVYIGGAQLSGIAAAGSPTDSSDSEAGAAAARRSAERALTLMPEFGEASALKGRAALALKAYPAAVAAFAEAQLRLPDRADIVYNRFVAHIGAGQLVQARALVEGRLRQLAEPDVVAQAREMVSRSEASHWIEVAVAAANEAMAKGDLDGAIAAFEEAQGKVASVEANAYLTRQIEQLHEAKRDQSGSDAFNAAVADIHAGRLSKARDRLLALLVDCHPAQLCDRAKELLTEVERRSKGRP